MTQWLERAPRQPRILEQAFEEPDQVRALIPRHAPYWPTLRYVANDAELRSFGSDSTPRPQRVMPWFRGDWAYEEPRVEGAEAILANAAFATAAREVFDAEVVRPKVVYVNVMVAIPFAGAAHIDVPAFRGIERTDYPVWFLHAMNRSGLFEAWRVDIATAVSWFFDGVGGEFDYWPAGPLAPPERISAPLGNRAVVGDNDVMFHRVAAVGPPGGELPEGDGVRAELCYEQGEVAPWAIVDAGKTLARHAERDVRVSVSWKAEVFSDAASARIREDHTDDLDLEQVLEIFRVDLHERGVVADGSEELLRNPDFTAAVTEAYPLPDVVG